MARVGQVVKESIAGEVSSTLAERPNFFVTKIGRLPATEADALRQKLHASQARLVVVKRRIGRRVIDGLKVPGLAELLEGSIGLVLAGEDVLPAAKIIVEFRKAHEDQLAVRGGLIDGQLLDAGRVEQLASLPPRPILLSQVVGMIEAPIAQLIGTLEQLVGDIAWIAEQAAAAKPDEPAAPAASAEAAPAKPDEPAAPAAKAETAPPAPPAAA